MKIAVLGATGQTGRRIVEVALSRGHQVVALARQVDAITVEHTSLTKKKADVLDRGALEAGFAGADAIISALGPSGRDGATVFSEGTSNILAAMTKVQVHRLAVISAIPAAAWTEASWLERSLIYPLLWRFLGSAYRGMRVMEAELAKSETAWTVFRPPMLTNGAATGKPRMAVNEHLRGAQTLSRADLAAAMVTATEAGSYPQSFVNIAN